MTRKQVTTTQPRFEIIRQSGHTDNQQIRYRDDPPTIHNDIDKIPAHYSERIVNDDTRKQEFSFAIADYEQKPEKEQFIITRPSKQEKTQAEKPINFPTKSSSENEDILDTDENDKVDLRTGAMVCCSCTERPEDCPSQSNLNITSVSSNQSEESRNLSKRDIPTNDIISDQKEEQVQLESDSSLNTHCPRSHSFPCFCYNTELEDAKGELKSPALDVHLSFDTNTEQFDVHRVHITKPSFDYDTLYCLRENIVNEEGEDQNSPQETLVTTADEEEIDNTIEALEYDEDEIWKDNDFTDLSTESPINISTQNENSKPSKESHVYGLEALIKYKIKKVKTTWNKLKNLLNY